MVTRRFQGKTVVDASVNDGGNVKAIADQSVVGGIPLLFMVDMADDASAADIDIIMKHKVQIIDAWVVKTAANGGAGDAVTVQNAANAITDAMSLNIADTTIARATTLDDAQFEIAADGTLKLTRVYATNNAAKVYIVAVRV